MVKVLGILFAFLLGAFAMAQDARAQVDQQEVVNSAASTLERMKGDSNFQKEFQPRLAESKGVMIVPGLYKGGFFFGAQYGNAVLLVHQADGGWSYPAFYTITGGSFGLQIGLTDVPILFIIRTEKGLNAILNNQFKFGADADVTFVVVGAGMNGSTTTAFGADIVALSLGGIGLYGGLSLEGTMVAARESWDAAYYHKNVATRAIVEDNAVTNSGADKLRDLLSH